MKDQYLLSICIPTRNRADVLKQNIDSIVKNPYFCDEIEVVVSDNGSTDDTQRIMSSYAERYSNVKYYRDEEYIGMHGNIVRVTELATGEFLKLSNDYNVFTQEGLKYLIDSVRGHRDSHQLLFFENDIVDGIEVIEDVDINQIVAREGWAFSWMSSYGFWRDDWAKLDNKKSRVETMFIMDGHFLQMLERKGTVTICHAHFTERYPFKQKQGGYNFFRVHTINYLLIFDEYYQQGKINKEAYDSIHYKLFCSLLPFLTKFLITEKSNYTYELDGWFKYFFQSFGRHPWFYKKMVKWSWNNRKYIFSK